MPAPIPAATYRLQFNKAFTFDAATGIVDYLDALGISHAYASSYLCAVPGSMHGYDVTDPTRLNPEIGDEQTYQRWIEALRAHDMGHILDLVPNHMGIALSANPWWQDVLENGPSSPYAPIFDIDWHPLKPQLENKVLLPILGDSYGVVLERQEIQLEYAHGALMCPLFRLHLASFTRDLRPGVGQTSGGAHRGDRNRERGRDRVPEHPERHSPAARTGCAGPRASDGTHRGKRKSSSGVLPP